MSARLRAEFLRLRDEGTRLAGRLTDVPQRAAVYHQIYVDSGRHHVFPLIAAHGALWLRGYFTFGLRLARVLSWQYALSRGTRERQLESLVTFLDCLRDINRRVCADTYATYHFVERFGHEPGADEIIPHSLLDGLLRVHTARQARQELSDDEKLSVFEAHFRNEQDTVVGRF